MSVSKKAQKLSLVYGDKSQDITKNISVDPGLEALIPPLSEEEFQNLQESIRREGCREPITLWKKEGAHILVDGHNRYRICQTNNIKFDFTVRQFQDIVEVKNWMLANQMSRRNLSPLQMSYLRGLRYETEKQGHGGLRATGQNDRSGFDTSKKLAEEFSVGEKTIRRDAKFTIGLNRLTEDNPQLRWGILNGEVAARKQTVSDLADQEDAFLDKLKSKFEETSNLEKAIKLIVALENEVDKPEEVNESRAILKRMNYLLKKVAKVDHKHPDRKDMIREVKSLLDDYLKTV